MGKDSKTAQWSRRILGGVFLLILAGGLCCMRPAMAQAQDYEAMLPEALSREVHKAEVAYRKAIDEANLAETERMARAAAGAAEAELRELDAKVGALVTKAEKLKVQSDYLGELYESKRKEYKTR